jgi:hypothetical protein
MLSCAQHEPLPLGGTSFASQFAEGMEELGTRMPYASLIPRHPAFLQNGLLLRTGGAHVT